MLTKLKIHNEGAVFRFSCFNFDGVIDNIDVAFDDDLLALNVDDAHIPDGVESD